MEQSEIRRVIGTATDNYGEDKQLKSTVAERAQMENFSLSTQCGINGFDVDGLNNS